ncbi:MULTISPECIES: hypothetical protein [Culturomica]|uniref:hypothetical protein n=2 Tax=Odoribacteraceae TaxID=1853231 RepID=UPI000335A196|nr:MULTISPECIES: hypothetical protein [Culturomica]CCZ08333.1 putative uncharacterized protein [Odoribacter sp. CAG:788]
MEMNRYLIAALYVMAGCVVTVPLKVQGNPEPLRGERCRLIVTTTVKTVSEYVGDQEAEQLVFDLAPEYFWSPDIAVHKTIFLSDYGKAEQIETPAYTSHKIRAPGL